MRTWLPWTLTVHLLAQAPAPIRAQYAWAFAGPEGTGKGTLAVLLEPGSGRVVLELHGLGERLMMLSGQPGQGFRIQVPRQNLDTSAPTLGALPVPFMPALGSPEGLHLLLEEGRGPGVKVTRRDASGPRKLRYDGKDDRGKEITVWLTRERWERN